MKRWIFALLGLGIQLTILLALGIYYALPYCFGQNIVVQTRSIDPPDFFRGNYDALRYDFSFPDFWQLDHPELVNKSDNQATVKRNNIFPADKDKFKSKNRKDITGKNIYAVLEPKTNADIKSMFSAPVYQLKYLTLTRPTSGVYLTGVYNKAGFIQYGIERFYLTDSNRHHTFNSAKRQVLLTVNPFGQARIRDVKP